MRRLGLAALPLALALGACAPATSRESPELAAKADGWEAAFNAGDIDALVAMYTEDARLLPPNAEMAQGRDAVRAEFSELLGAGLKAELETVEAVVAADIGYRVGTYSLLGPDGAVMDRGKYIEIWRQLGGEWTIANDIWNSDMPAAAESD